MNARRRKKAYRKMMEGGALRGNECAAIWNGKGDFTKKVVKQMGLHTKEWFALMAKEWTK